MNAALFRVAPRIVDAMMQEAFLAYAAGRPKTRPVETTEYNKTRGSYRVPIWKTFDQTNDQRGAWLFWSLLRRRFRGCFSGKLAAEGTGSQDGGGKKVKKTRVGPTSMRRCACLLQLRAT